MHELPIIKKVLATALLHADEHGAKEVRSITLEVGETHDLIPELVQKYFRFVGRGTIAEKAELIYHTLPIICRCGKCGDLFQFHLRFGERTEVCPLCGGDQFTFISGDEFFIDKIEIA